MGKSKSSKKSGSKKSKGKKIEFCEGRTEFNFPNGDRYVGQYCAHASGVIWRHGDGVYITNDGQVYEGVWKEDKLMDKKEARIMFANGDAYEGVLVKQKYQGGGIYRFGTNITLMTNFAGNKPTQSSPAAGTSMVLVGPKGKVWYGNAVEHHSIVLPEHNFYTNMEPVTGRSLAQPPKLELTPAGLLKEEMRLRIFGKSGRTDSELSFGDFEPIELKGIETPPPEMSLLDRFYGDEYQNSYKPIPVIYPTN